MLKDNFGVKFFLSLLLFVSFACTTRVHASTITVVPGEAQSQIQAAINNSHAGDTIAFQAGTFNICGLRLVAGRSYLGATSGQTVLHGPYTCSVMIFYGSGLTVQHITFDGGGLYLGGGVTNVNVEYNTFQNISYGPTPTKEWGNWTTTIGIFVDTSATNSDFSYNSFHNLATQILHQNISNGLGVTAIMGYNLNNVTMNYNTFDTINEGIHFFGVKNSQANYNVFINFHRVAMEFQDGTQNLEIGFNTYSQPLAPFWDTFGISVAITGGNAIVHDNQINADNPIDCTGLCRAAYGIEAWGIGTTVTNNVIQGHWLNGVAIGPSQNLTVANNKVCGPEMQNTGYVINQRGVQWSGESITSNVLSTQLTCQ
jgi:hypothetical protein